MKNKAKKILAGVGLGIVGAMTLTGCTMSSEQMDAINKVVEKTDEIIELVDRNNKQLERQDAILLYKYARAKLQLNKNNVWDNLIVDATYNDSEGNEAKYITHFYKTSSGSNVLYSIDNNEVCNYLKDTQEATLSQGSFEYYAYSLVVGTSEGMTIDVTLDNLVDCSLLDNGNYVLTCIDKGAILGYDDIDYIFECEISEDGVMYSMNYCILEKETVGGSHYKMDYSFTNAKIVYKYGELSETIVQANIDAYNAQ